VVFVHGGDGTPALFAPLASALQAHADCAAFCYSDHARLVISAEHLRHAVRDLARTSSGVVIVAHSMGALLAAYIGATDPERLLVAVRALYVNPLIGGSLWADADPILARLGELPGLVWLHRVKRLIQRACFPPCVRDLAPESDFAQTIFGRGSTVSSFREHTRIVFTERPGEGPDVRPARAPRLFGRTRPELIERLGTVVPIAPGNAAGHRTPLMTPALLVPLIESLLDGPSHPPPAVRRVDGGRVSIAEPDARG
jgi:pimeloyl-ACP methyl ester carboxylesterase